MSSDGECTFGGDVPADESTDDEVGDEVVIRRVGLLCPRPCLWVRIVHKFLLNRFCNDDLCQLTFLLLIPFAT